MEVSPGQDSAAKNCQWQFPVVLILFTGSGFTSLVYQVVWTRLLSLVLGSTTLAAAVVLAVFMSGLALGSFIAGRLAHTVKRPLFAYGMLEALIGLWALLVPFLFSAAVPLYKLAWQNFHLSFASLSSLQAVIAASVLLVPTTMMGATLPLLSKFTVTNLEKTGSRIGALYTANTLGAVLGIAASGFCFLPLLGRQATTWIAVLINLFLALAAIYLAKSKSPEDDQIMESPGANAASVFMPLYLWAFAVSGAVAMIYEVGWTRALLTVIGSTTYAFSCMLLSFLGGIFAGSLLISAFVDRIKRPLLWFAGLEFLLCAVGLLSMYMFNYWPYWSIALNAQWPFDANLTMGVRFLLAGGILFPLALCLGAIFPLVIKAYANDLNSTGSRVGTAYAVNTLGAICGALLAGFVLIPSLGTERMLILASAANIVIALLVLYAAVPVRTEIKAAATIVGLITFSWCWQINAVWDRQIMLLTQHERRKLSYPGASYKLPGFEQWRRSLHDSCRVLFLKDGASSLVGVVQFQNPSIRSLITNGHMDGSDAADLPANILLAAYPLLFKPEAKDVGVIGWGTGALVSTVLKFPVKSVDAVELEPKVLETAELFQHVNFACLKDPRLHVEINDGRNYLQVADKRYDVLISEPSNPWQAGVCNLFTREYFEICRQRLKPDGILSLWLQTHEVPPENIKGILAALRSVFPYEVGLMINSTNVCVLASRKPLLADYQKIERCLSDADLLKALKPVNLDSAANAIARIGFTQDSIDILTRQVKPNIDDTNKLEYAVGRSYENQSFNDENRRNFVASMLPPFKAVAFGDLDKRSQALLMAAVAKQTVEISRPSKATAIWVKESMSLAPNADALTALGMLYVSEGQLRQAEEMWRQALLLEPQNIATFLTRADVHLKLRQWQAAERDFLTVLALDSRNLTARYYLAQLAVIKPVAAASPEKTMEKQAQAVLKYLGDLPENAKFVEQHPDVLSLAAMASINTAQDDRAERYLRQYLKYQPKSIASCRRLSNLLLRNGKVQEAREWLSRAEELEDEKYHNPDQGST